MGDSPEETGGDSFGVGDTTWETAQRRQVVTRSVWETLLGRLPRGDRW